MKIVLKSVLILLLFTRCEEVINLDLNFTGPELVIEGLITDEDQSFVFKLTETQPYDFKYNVYSQQFVTGATLIIEDDHGSIDTLTEIDPGKYQTDSTITKGVIGHTYTLDVFAPDGKHYKSYPQKMVSVPKIDSIYYERDHTDISETNPSYYKFYIYIDWQDPEDYQNYYLRTFSYFWNNAWHDNVNWNWVFNDKYMNGKYLKKDLVQEEYGGKNFLVQIRQYSLNEEAYQFWNLVHEQIHLADNGIANASTSLYGNIYDVDDPDKYTLGFFQVSSVQTAEVYISD